MNPLSELLGLILINVGKLAQTLIVPPGPPGAGQIGPVGVQLALDNLNTPSAASIEARNPLEARLNTIESQINNLNLTQLVGTIANNLQKLPDRLAVPLTEVSLNMVDQLENLTAVADPADVAEISQVIDDLLKDTAGQFKNFQDNSDTDLIGFVDRVKARVTDVVSKLTELTASTDAAVQDAAVKTLAEVLELTNGINEAFKTFVDTAKNVTINAAQNIKNAVESLLKKTIGKAADAVNNSAAIAKSAVQQEQEAAQQLFDQGKARIASYVGQITPLSLQVTKLNNLLNSIGASVLDYASKTQTALNNLVGNVQSSVQNSAIQLNARLTNLYANSTEKIQQSLASASVQIQGCAAIAWKSAQESLSSTSFLVATCTDGAAQKIERELQDAVEQVKNILKSNSALSQEAINCIGAYESNKNAITVLTAASCVGAVSTKAGLKTAANAVDMFVRDFTITATVTLAAADLCAKGSTTAAEALIEIINNVFNGCTNAVA